VGALGSAAILMGSVMALRQARLKLLIAYSTVAQIGYLFLLFPLAASSDAAIAWTGGMLQVVSHAFAKAAMFLAAGLVGEALGHDRIDGLRGLGRALPMTAFALGLGGLSLMGLPLSGGFSAKFLLLLASIASGQWWWAVVILAGGLLAGGYVFRILAPAIAEGAPALAPIARERQALALALALVAVLLGLLPLRPMEFLGIGR
jgi:formate hydrogenlyase subunit 3/multisubunit Na+/H+ antiporter MnhD subunit